MWSHRSKSPRTHTPSTIIFLHPYHPSSKSSTSSTECPRNDPMIALKLVSLALRCYSCWFIHSCRVSIKILSQSQRLVVLVLELRRRASDREHFPERFSVSTSSSSSTKVWSSVLCSHCSSSTEDGAKLHIIIGKPRVVGSCSRVGKYSPEVHY